MGTNNLEPGYWTATEERLVNRYDTLEEAERHIKFQREHMGNKATWYIIHIPIIKWLKTDKYEP